MGIVELVVVVMVGAVGVVVGVGGMMVVDVGLVVVVTLVVRGSGEIDERSRRPRPSL